MANIKANAKHYTALLMISLGAMGILCGVVGLAIAVTKLTAVGVVCGLIGAVPGVWLFRSGWKMRRAAIAAGSSAHLGEGENEWTEHTEAAKPSFLKGKPKDE